LTKDLKESVRDARLRETERLLREERLGLDAIVTAFLQEVPVPERLMERLDQMAAVAIERNLSARACDAILFGQQMYRRRLERHLLKQQELLPRDEPELIAADNGTQATLIEPQDLHVAQTAAERELRERVLAIFRIKGGLTDRELVNHYRATYGGGVARQQVTQARKALRRQGLLANRAGSDWIWDLRERETSA
jgi:hypothetical protein